MGEAPADRLSLSKSRRIVRNVAGNWAASLLRAVRFRANVAAWVSKRMSLIARLAVSIFFPQFKVLGCDVDQSQTPAVLSKISIAAARDCSCKTVGRNLKDLAELEVTAKQCQRVAIRIGNERLDEQAQRIEQYSQAKLQSKLLANPRRLRKTIGRVAVVQADGGRVQVRDEL